MRLKIWSLSFLLLASLCWDSNAQNYRVLKLKLSSGKELRPLLIGKACYKYYLGDDPCPVGLEFRYSSDVAFDDKAALRKEIDEIWEVFQKDVEDAQLKGGTIISMHRVIIEGSDFSDIRNHIFVFEKRDDGKWHCLDDDKKKD